MTIPTEVNKRKLEKILKNIFVHLYRILKRTHELTLGFEQWWMTFYVIWMFWECNLGF